MLGWIKNRLSIQPPNAIGPPCPDGAFYVVGDIHGCEDLLERLLDRLDLALPVVFVGDYIDRGPHSAQVLKRLHVLQTSSEGRITCLIGNHEIMMLAFLNDPVANARWLRHGGVQTLASYGIAIRRAKAEPDVLINARDRLRAALGSELPEWIAALPRTYQSGNVAVVHAAADPKVSIQKQSEKALIWGHPKFGRTHRKDGLWIAHGHTVVDTAFAENGIIAVDTGAYATGTLTAAHITMDEVTFVSVY